MSYLWITKRVVKSINNYKCHGLINELSKQIHNDNLGLIDHKYYQGLTLDNINKYNNNDEIIWSCSLWSDYLNMKKWENSNNRIIILNKYNKFIIHEEHEIMYQEKDNTFLL